MTSIQRLPHTVSKQLNRDNKKSHFSMRGLGSVFCQRHSSRICYHNRTDWLQYHINLVKIVPVDLQQKNNLSINNWLDPQTVIGFSACTRYSKWCLLCVVYYFLCWKYFRSWETNKKVMSMKSV